MKYLIITVIILLTYNFTYAQKSFNLTGKTFENINKDNGKEQYTFISNTEAKLIMLYQSEFSGKTYKDVCLCKCSVEGNKVKVSCNCEDKETFPDPLEETFIYDERSNTLATTRILDRFKKPRIFNLKF